jgi:hypothetical protein
MFLGQGAYHGRHVYCNIQLIGFQKLARHSTMFVPPATIQPTLNLLQGPRTLQYLRLDSLLIFSHDRAIHVKASIQLR